MKNHKISLSNVSHTYSIVARDRDTGELGVAVQSHWFSVGSLVAWADAGVGAVATQALVNTSFGPRGLNLLREGRSAPEVVEQLLQTDDGRNVRQVAVIDSKGRVAAHTGSQCIAEAGHIIGDDFSVQANLMLNDTIWPAMAAAFERSEGPLPERMVVSLEAAQAAGGDIRGRQSAALLVVKGQATDQPWIDRAIDLRVEDHPQPVLELKRLLQVFRTYEFMNQGDAALERDDADSALSAYRTAASRQPDNLEIKFWYAVSLANTGKVAEALPIFKEIFGLDENWAIVVERLRPAGLLNINEQEFELIRSQRS